MLFDPKWYPSKKAGIAPVPGIVSQVDSAESNSPYIKEEVLVLDFRNEDSFDRSHIPGSLNLAVDSEHDLNPFKDTQTMVRQFKNLEAKLCPDFCKIFAGRKVLTLSHRGHVGRLAMSILRNRSVNAHCVMGGREKWESVGLWGRW